MPTFLLFVKIHLQVKNCYNAYLNNQKISVLVLSTSKTVRAVDR